MVIDNAKRIGLVLATLTLSSFGTLAAVAYVADDYEAPPPETTPESWYYAMTYTVGPTQTIIHVATISDRDTETRRSTNLSETPEGLPQLEAVIIVLPFDASTIDLGEDALRGLNAAMTTQGDALAYFRARSRMSGEDYEIGIPSRLENAAGDLVPIGSVVLTSTLTREMTVIGATGIRQWDSDTRAECARWAEDCADAGWDEREEPVMRAG